MSQKSLLIILVQTLHIMREFDAKMGELKILAETNLHELK